MANAVTNNILTSNLTPSNQKASMVYNTTPILTLGHQATLIQQVSGKSISYSYENIPQLVVPITLGSLQKPSGMICFGLHWPSSAC